MRIDEMIEGMHRWYYKLTYCSDIAIGAPRQHVNELLSQVKAMPTETWGRDDRIDWVLFRAQLEREAFWGRILKFEETNPQTYVNECSTAIFSLLKKEYAPPRSRELEATARLKQMPALLAQGKRPL